MRLNKKSKQLLLIIFVFLLLYNRASVKIIILPNLSNINQKIPTKYWVGEKYNILLKKSFDIKYENIYLKSKNNHVNLNLLDGKIIMKSSGRECLVVYTKKLKEYACFNIYNTPNINFKENNPIKLETNTSRRLIINRYDYPKSNIRYKSNNPGIIMVNKDGEIKALRPGMALISVSGLDNKTFTINVVSLVSNGFINNYMLENLKANLYDKIMIVAHPDDEILWGGANLYKDKYFIVCITNGYNELRAKEFRKSLNFTKSGGIILNYTDLQDNKISNWSEIENGIIKDLIKIINYKKWDKIVTHGPEGTTGHPHHKKISKYVSQIAKKYNKFNNLYYFGKFYKKGKIPQNLTTINKTELEFKINAIKLYQYPKKAINNLWKHFLPYENWILASKWKNILDKKL